MIGKKTAIFISLAIIGVALYIFGEDYLSLEKTKEMLSQVQEVHDANPVLFVAGFVIAYAVMVLLYLPGPIFLNLLAGAVMGAVGGVVSALVAVTLGSLMAFLAARYLLHDWVRNKFPRRSKSVDKAIKRSGWMYITMLRLAPGVPVGLTNLLAGVSGIRMLIFAAATLLGSIPWIIFYVAMGQQLMRIDSMSKLVDTEMMLIAGGLMLVVLASHIAMRKMSGSSGGDDASKSMPARP